MDSEITAGPGHVDSEVVRKNLLPVTSHTVRLHSDLGRLASLRLDVRGYGPDVDHSREASIMILITQRHHRSTTSTCFTMDMGQA